MVASKTSGELVLMSETTTQFRSTNSLPNTISAMLTVSAARSGWVTEPMKGLSE